MMPAYILKVMWPGKFKIYLKLQIRFMMKYFKCLPLHRFALESAFGKCLAFPRHYTLTISCRLYKAQNGELT